ncbi:sodium:phosphate symporter [Halosolutus halophilus]|uniref:sodium:phosphate symporter n=1 Tax=Halosolutus halophilus TaxID=1552990 RepID=UPI002234EF69|nr:sodium:phosphate symporter [Halosolutus halophilus]
MDTDRRNDLLERGRASGPLLIGVIVSLLLFLFAVQLLGTSTEAAVVPLERLFRRYVAGSGPALGVSWLATYVLTNGSVVAALSVSLFKAGILTASQLFLMVAGSRLGAAAIVLLIGGLDYFQKRRYSIGEATSLGVLTFLLTHTVYVPATVLGYLLLPSLRTMLGGVSDRFELSRHPLAVFEPVTGAIIDAIGVGLGLVVALLALFVSLTLFDRVLERVDTEWLRRRFFRRFQHKWTSFGLGILVTGATTSIAFSLGVVVPLYNRNYVTRREIVPYILGANIGTLFDTVLIAILLESTAGATIVLSLLAVGTIITGGILLWFPRYFHAVETVQLRLVADYRYLAAFLLSLVVVPVLLVSFPF